MKTKEFRTTAKKISAKSFRRYGTVIEYPGKNSKSKEINLFRIVLKESKPTGWRIAYLVVRDRSIRKLEQHPGSFESFEPVKGKSLLYVSKRLDRKIECFCLDKPVILKKGIWHGVVTLGKESEIKIAENAEVQCIYRLLDFSLGRD